MSPRTFASGADRPRFSSSDLVIFQAAAELYREGKPDTTVQNRAITLLEGF
jgi:hypothetical protein